MITKKDDLWRPVADETGVDYILGGNWIPKFLYDTCIELNISTKSVVHAGGNIGAYAIEFSKYFDNVYTFEPDDDNFSSLMLNCANYKNIFPFKCALGNINETILINNPHPNNCGTWQVQKKSGNIPTLRIDNLALTDVGLIHLDVEGFELFVLKGGLNTIKRCNPLIVVEKMEHNNAYNYTYEDLVNFLLNIGYNITNEYCSDEVMFYKGDLV